MAKLAGMLADERDRLGQLAAGDLRVRAAFTVSYRQLADGDARMFRLLGLHPGPDFDKAAAASLAGTGPETAGALLDRLVLASLVTENAAGRFGMHDLLRLFARQTCQETDDQEAQDAAAQRLTSHFVKLAQFLDSCLDPRQRPAAANAAEQAGRSLPSPGQALAMFEADRLNMLAVFGTAVHYGWHQVVWQLGDAMSYPLEVLWFLDELLIMHRAQLNAARDAGNTTAEGRALASLGLVYGELKRFEDAITCLEEARPIIQETGDRLAEGSIVTNLGSAYRDLKHFEKAISCYEEALEIRRVSGDRQGEAITLLNLGNLYVRLQRYTEATSNFEQSLAIFRETGNRRGEGQILNNLSLVYVEQRQFEEAINYLQQDLAICREFGDRHGEAQTLANLGGVYQEMKQPGRAASYWRDAAGIMREARDYEEAAKLEQMAAGARPRRRRLTRRS